MINSDQNIELFETEHVFLQWLNRYKSKPIKWEKEILWSLWTLVIINVLIIYYVDNISYYLLNSAFSLKMIDLWYFSIGSLAIFHSVLNTLIVFLYFMPAVLKDFLSKKDQQLFYITPIPSRELIRDLRSWAIKISLRHIFPSAVFICSIFIIFTSRTARLGTSDFNFLLSLLFAIFIYSFTVWRMLLSIGMLFSVLPEFKWLTSSISVLLAVSVLSITVWLMIHIFTILDIDFSGNYTAMGLYYPTDNIFMVIFALALAVIIEILTQLCGRQVIPCLEKRRSGVWA